MDLTPTTQTCVNCGELIRPIQPSDGIDGFEWTHNWVDSAGVDHAGSPICDITLTATPERTLTAKQTEGRAWGQLFLQQRERFGMP